MMTSSRHRHHAAREIDARQEIARQDLATAFAQIFTPRVRGKRQWVETQVDWNKGFVEIAGPELNATELLVLLAVLAIAGRDGAVATPAAGVDAANAALGKPHITVSTSLRDIAKMIGRHGRDGTATRMVDDALTRLMGVVISARSEGGVRGKDHLIERTREAAGKVSVRLNWRATRAILGERGQWACVDMARLRGATEIECILMHRLAAHCTGGAPFPVSLERLVQTCWTRPAKNARRQLERIDSIRAALPHALPQDITVTVDGRGVVRFLRGDRIASGGRA